MGGTISDSILGGTKHFFLLILYNFKNIGGGTCPPFPLPPSPPYSAVPAQASFIQLRTIWKSKIISSKTKIQIYRSNVRAVLLYGSERWTMTEADLSISRGFDNKSMRRILQTYWPNVISNNDLEKTTRIPQIDIEIKKRRWTGIG